MIKIPLLSQKVVVKHAVNTLEMHPKKAAHG